ncbi:MAG: bifunctional ADP-dependent NAD(P)H-hydrate dehydratase/NAD(P)H-hydrate epimerase [Phycicoccus sp.]|nr:bifunctional ADP-dependent NAD(P)H-hydrate dehydratase/NAD(P)H-hydrate epimerase [Phycicoccus sp.]
MIQAWAARDVYAAESALLAELPEGELMARAVAGLADVVAARMTRLGARRVVALVGPGNNGADALYAAASLARQGFLCAAVHTDRVHMGAHADAQAAGVVLDDDPATTAATVADADVVLDGILGIGGRGGLPAYALPWVAAIADDAYVVAVDTPSGQPVDGGSLDPEGVFADETVTFSLLKPVHLLPPTEAVCGLLTVVDIGIVAAAPAQVCRLTTPDVSDTWPIPTAADDKYSRGVLGVIAGGERYPGAAVLTVTAAVEAGAGMVRYVGPSTPSGLVRSAVPEAVHGAGRVQAWVVGPGVDPASTDPADRDHLRAAVAALREDVPCLVDAGGLDLFADVVARWGPRAAPTLLTPHAGECARLLSRLTDSPVDRACVEADPLGHARALAAASRAAVLLKGSTTLVVESAEGAVWSQADAPPWLATAGAGDVLAGLAGMLLAAGLAPGTAGALAALVHGRAADRANPGGPVRALALAQCLGQVVAAELSVGHVPGGA